MNKLQKLDQLQDQTSISLRYSHSLMKTINSLLPEEAGSSVNMSAMTEFIDVQMSMTIPRAMKGAQISILKKEFPTDLLKAVSTLITTTATSMNITNNLNSFQVYEATQLICKEFWYLRLEELILIFKNGKLGKYGRIYNKLDITIISDWINQYETSEERVCYFERKNTEHKANLKNQEEMSEESMEKFAEIYRDLFPEEEEPKEKTPVNPQTHEKFLQTLSERIRGYSDEILEMLQKDCKIRGYKSELQIVEREITARKPVKKPKANKQVKKLEQNGIEER